MTAPPGDVRLSDVLETIAAATAAPGGGAVTALAGAFAAALVSMVCGISRKRKGMSAEHLAWLEATQIRADACRRCLLALADEDSTAYASVLAAYRLPKEERTRADKIEKALQRATEIPLQVAERCSEVAALARQLVEQDISTATGDALVAVLLAEAAVQGAVSNVRINTAPIQDTGFVAAARAAANDGASRAWQARTEAMDLMTKKWGGNDMT